MYKHIELHRRFLTIDKPEDAESFSFESYISTKRADDSIGCCWDDILNSNDNVVILGEPGSGKTRELEAQVSNLLNQSKCAAFIELGQMVNATSPPP